MHKAWLYRIKMHTYGIASAQFHRYRYIRASNSLMNDNIWCYSLTGWVEKLITT